MTVKLFTLCIVRDGDNVLLGMKKRGFGEGKWNGFGGKVDPAETIEEAAYRELEEEVGITASAMELRAQFDFVCDANPTTLRVSVYLVTDYTGEPSESEEMRPQWFHRDEIPYDVMWKDDVYWLPRFLDGERLRGTFRFDDLESLDAKLLEYELHEITSEGYLKGAVARRGQDPKTGLWTKRDAGIEQFTSVKRTGGTFLGIRKEDEPMWRHRLRLYWLRLRRKL